MAGAKPSFTKSHEITALLTLYPGRTSRKKLSESLGVGEGSVRTILDNLHSRKMVESDKTGHTLSDTGKAYVEKLLGYFTLPAPLKSRDMLVGEHVYYSWVAGSKEKLSRQGTVESVTALKEGADSAVILVKSRSGLKFPSKGFHIKQYNQTVDELTQNLDELNPGDVIVLTSADTKPVSINSLTSVIMLLKKELFQ